MPESRARGDDWVVSGLLLVAIGVAAAGLGRVLADVSWWFTMMLVAGVILAAAAAVRSFVSRRLWSAVVAILAGTGILTLMFASESALLGVLPTFDTLDLFRALESAGNQSIAVQDLPADADRGILFLLCLGVAIIAVAMDIATFTLRAPALAGVPLLALLIVPSLVDPDLHDAFVFVLVAVVYLAILLVRSRPGDRRTAITIASAAVVAALVVPLALPGVQRAASASGAAGSISAGINPIITLGNDLRRGDPALALTYTTTEPGGVYLRLTALDDFSGSSWEPTATEVIPGNDVSAIGPAPGVGATVATTEVTTNIAVQNILSRWLPAPYAPSSVTGLVGEWSWEPDALGIRSLRSSARGQQYQVISSQIAPSVDQLVATGTTVEAGFERYLALPDELGPVVARTAAEVVGDASTNYDKALALQDFFRGGDFTYSEEAPVENGYDGTGADVLAEFLDARAGYCVHFASAMATMARTQGIPSRVAVGFTPGTVAGRDVGGDRNPGGTAGGNPSGTDETADGGADGDADDTNATETNTAALNTAAPSTAAPNTDETTATPDTTDTVYEVTTYDLHAWPELYFAGIGWVRFEPTPGRGQVPAFAPLAVDDPATPDVDESVPPPAATAAPTAAPSLPPEDAVVPDASPTADAARTTSSPPYGALMILGLLLVLAIPFGVRSLLRDRRLKLVRDGSSAAAWDEVRDTADDLGLRTADSRTPRQLVDDLAPHLDGGGHAALDRLRRAVEAEAFAGGAGSPRPDDVRTVIRSLRRQAGVRASFIAAIAPRTLVAAWLPVASRVD